MSLLIALLLQVGPDPMRGALPDDDLVRDRPPREAARSALAQEMLNPTTAWLERCLDQLAEDPARAHAMAQIRRSETSGADRVLANHCLGTAATELGLWEDARMAFIAAREETPTEESRTRARFATMAGNAALASGDAAGALGLLEMAESDARSAASAPLQALAAIDRARALVALGRSEEALAALGRATQLTPDNTEAWLLNATLLRRLDRLGLAQEAIERAASLAPGNPEIGLEAGVIAVLSGRDEAARESWQSVINLAPESPAAKTAQGYLTQLGPSEAAPDQEPPA
ncbi:tetratricopeptide repeat protein [Erythrobacter dokdonensis]|uniref:Tetratricopeptide TPR_4 n=1 Tax=Erythrobacter dokdonensis DSW-74 TaxID=1300349 RepID=A0A1A7BHD7_9SPHN|nr:tetratricopeptide repeat protein [Erythrobacter dokdonensis]MEE4316081.1 tetratricopeptide repeat protein [Erythrobacter sp.]OBV11131.1 Tetratricopeptide TPR_4 [Erythrobacter dokdonensis DSW-74]